MGEDEQFYWSDSAPKALSDSMGREPSPDLEEHQFQVEREEIHNGNVVLYPPLKCHNIWIENTFIHMNTETIEVKEKKEHQETGNGYRYPSQTPVD